MKSIYKLFFILFFISKSAFADDVRNWLKDEIDIILNVYKDNNLSNIERFEYIEDTINKNFAGAGIGKFVAGKAWEVADKDIKQDYIKLFKQHLALNIASMLKGYANQTYSLFNVKKRGKEYNS